MCMFCGGICEVIGLGVLIGVVHKIKKMNIFCKWNLHDWRWIPDRSKHRPAARRVCRCCGKEFRDTK